MMKVKKHLFAAFLALLALLFAGVAFIGVKTSAKAADAPVVSPIRITATGNAFSDPYSGWKKASANTWWSPSTPCLFGGSNESEASVDSYSEIYFKVSVSGYYQVSVTAQTYKNSVELVVGSYEAESGNTAMPDTTVRFLTHNTYDSPAGQADLAADKIYVLRLQGKSGFDVYVRYLTLTYAGSSIANPLSEISLTGLSDTQNETSATLGETFVLPQATASNGSEVSVTVYAPDGEVVSAKNGSFIPTRQGNYLIVYATEERDYSTRTLIVKTEREYTAATSFELLATNFTEIENFSVSPTLGVGGTAQRSSASVTFGISTFETLKGSPLKISIGGYSPKTENRLAVSLNGGKATEFVFSVSPEKQTVVMNTGTLDGTISSGSVYTSVTVSALTEDGNLTLSDISCHATFNGIEREIFSKSFTELCADPSTQMTGNLTQSAEGMAGFNKFPASYATYTVHAKTAGEYAVILGYSRTENQNSSATVSLINGEQAVPVLLDSLSTQTAYTGNTAQNAYYLRFEEGLNTFKLQHVEGTGYFISSIRISNDLTPPSFTLSEAVYTGDTFVNAPLTLPYAFITDNDEQSYAVAEIVSDNKDVASVTGKGMQDDPFVFTATQSGTYVLFLYASDTANNQSDVVTFTVFVTETAAPVINVSLDSLIVHSGYLFTPPTATATYNGTDVSDSVKIEIVSANNVSVTEGKVAAAGYTHRFVGTGKYFLTWSCVVGGVAAYDKVVELDVLPTASITPSDPTVTVTGGFVTNTDGWAHPGDSAYASPDSFSFDFSLSKGGNFELGVNMDLYSTSYSLLYRFDKGNWYRLTAFSSSNPLEVFANDRIALDKGAHTLQIVAETVGGDTWIHSLILRNVDTGANKIFTAEELYTDPAFGFRSTGDVRYNDSAKTFGRINSNPMPTITASVNTQVNGYYLLNIHYKKSDVSEKTPVLYLNVNGTPFTLTLTATDTAKHILTQKVYLGQGSNEIALAGVSSRDYTVCEIEIILEEETTVIQAVLSAVAPTASIEPGGTFTVNAANVSDLNTQNVILSVKLGDAELYRGINQSLTFHNALSGKYTITYYYIDDNGVHAVAPVSFTVRVEAPKPTEEDSSDNKNSDLNGKGCGSSISAGLGVIALCIMTGMLGISKKRK